MTARRRILVIGGGITGLTVAAGLVEREITSVVVREAAPRLGGKIRTSPFGGLAAVDEGPDAFLTRVPEAVELARRLGLADGLTHPTGASAAVWWPDRGRHGNTAGALHPIPDGLVLGVPGALGPLARSGLISWRGKMRAAAEPFLPRTSTSHDSLGRFVRSRFGDQVHERLVDALVGSIYAADTDRTSLASVPQLAALAGGGRSLLLQARSARARAAGATGPLFAAPEGGIGVLVEALATAITDGGGSIVTGAPVTAVEPTADGTWRVSGAADVGGDAGEHDVFDAVVLATPARATAPLLAEAAPAASALMGQMEHADVILVTVAVPDDEWADELSGRSGYLVPKPVQRLVTAVSFGSEKWAHWRPADGTRILRASLGRDGLPVDHLDDDAAVAAVVDEMAEHLGLAIAPTSVRVSRWPAAFPQYRPHHDRWVDSIERELPAGLHVAGASYRGIGLPACIRDASRIVDRLAPGPST